MKKLEIANGVNSKMTLEYDNTNCSIICIDISGSVNGNIIYWNAVAIITEQWLTKYPQALFCFWNSNCYVSNKVEDLNKNINHRFGTGGTNSSLIAKCLKMLDISQHICIITDGEVNTSEIDLTEQVLTDYPINHVECHVIAIQPNLSVTCPFTRGNTSKVYTHEIKSRSGTDSRYNFRDVLSTASID